MNQRNKNKVINGVCIGFSAIVVVTVLFSAKYSIRNMFNTFFSPKATEVTLTDEQKLEDFEYLYDTVTTGMPMIDSFSDVYGYSFTDRKSEYEQLIKDTKTDLEFYVAIDQIMQDIPSFHTDLVSADSINTLHCYNSDKVTSDRTVISANKYWAELLDDKSAECENMQFSAFTYVDGYYYFDSDYSHNSDFSEYDKIISVDGVSVDEYAVSEQMLFGLHYDGQYDKAYRTRLIFNSSEGEKVTVKVERKDGTEVEKQMYSSSYYDELFFEWNYDNSDDSDESDFETADDDENKISYVMINSMGDTDGSEVKKAIKKAKYDNVILDLRENYGGNTEYASNYIYPYLYADDVSEQNYWYMPSTDENNRVLKNIFNRIILKPKKADDSPFESDFGFKKFLAKYDYNGKADKDKNVIILSGTDSGSACDRFISDMKNSGKTTVIGNNTGGEGLMGSYNCINLPNSKLVCIYMPSGAKNPDGTDNSVYGTSPDIYVSQTIDSFYAEEKSDSWDYEDKLTSDSVLIQAVDEFKNK
jgi:C-terminal processing protease CtpA/Prc